MERESQALIEMFDSSDIQSQNVGKAIIEYGTTISMEIRIEVLNHYKNIKKKAKYKSSEYNRAKIIINFFEGKSSGEF